MRILNTLREVLELVRLSDEERSVSLKWSTAVESRRSLVVWWKEHYNIPRSDPRYRKATMLDILEDYLDYLAAQEGPRDFDFERWTLEGDYESWKREQEQYLE